MVTIKSVIAIDGPAGAGKSTIARKLAQKLQYKHLDTGAMYRAVTWLTLKNDIKLKEKRKISQLAKNIDISFSKPDKDGKSKIFVNNKDITKAIRKPHVDNNVSNVARIKGVRKALVKQQRKMAQKGKIIMDGRDIGSRVLPDADLKIYLTASVEERAKRRYNDLKEKDENIDFEEVKKQIIKRDKIDTNRDISPLVKTEDAVCIDTTDKSINKTVSVIYKLIKEEGEQ